MKSDFSLFHIMKKLSRQAKKKPQQQIKALPVHIFYGIFFLHLIIFSLCFAIAMIRLDYSLLPLNPLRLIFWCVMPVLLYLWGTQISFYNFRNTKCFCLSAVLFSIYLVILSLAFSLLSRIFLPSILSLPVDDAFTKRMALLLGRVTTQLPLLPIGILAAKAVFFPLKDDVTRKKVLEYKITHSISPDCHSPSEIVYNMNIVKDIHSGKSVTVYAKDRFLHTLVDGTSGTGKTSSTILPAIRDDLDMRCRAEDIQKEKLLLMEQAGKISYSPSKNKKIFSINDCIPITKNTASQSDTELEQSLKDTQDQLEQIRLTYPVCGITVLAPDDSLTDDVCKLCDARGISYNRIDAVRQSDGRYKSNTIGLNPFYLPLHMDETSKNQLIVKKAVIFSDVMQTITELKGKADSYFVGLNRQMIANLAILVMATVPVLRHRQATPSDLQELINNFSLLPEYVDKLEELDRSTKQYTFIIQYIREDLLGKGRDKMQDQSRGTRNIINEFLLMPANKEIFCSQNSIDFDQALANGEVTVCNYNLASGDTDAVAFGLFFLLSFNNAVLSRPGTENTRIPHFFYLDELPVLIHPSLEKNFSLFRKFKVSMMVAIQTLDQMEKNEVTKYLKGVILGCAHIIVFGRSSLSDMTIFSSLAGVRDVQEEQHSTTETALTDTSPHLSFSSREIITQKNTIEEIDIRMKDFQEVTFFTTRAGRPLPALAGIVDFLKSTDWETKKRPAISLSRADTFTNYASCQYIKDMYPSTCAMDASSSFLESTPLSLFYSSSFASSDSKIPNELEIVKIPEGSENIDDMM